MKTQKQGDHHVKMKVEIAVMYLLAKEHQGLTARPETRKWQGTDLPPEPPKRNQFCQHLDLRLLDSRTMRQ